MTLRILVVDDTDQTREELVSGLLNHGFSEVVDVKSGDDAIRKVIANPQWFDVAVIDHILHEGTLDGIETARKLCESSMKEIFPIVFTNVPSDNPEVIRQYRSRAYEAGAYRYMYRGNQSDQSIKKVTDFVTEISQLRQLREKVKEFYEVQQDIPSLLTQLDVMVTLFDRTFRVWYRNPPAKRFEKTYCLPCLGCPMVPSSCMSGSPCRGCLVNETLHSGRARDGIYLQPVGRGSGLKYFSVWTHPIPDESDEAAKPIAVLQSVQDLTESDRLRAMPTETRLSIIARALFELPNGFDRVRIYAKTKGKNSLELIHTAGYNRDFKNLHIGITDYATFERSIKHFKTTGEGKFHDIPGYKDNLLHEELKEKFIHWPLMKGEKLLGMVSVNGAEGGRPCNRDGLDLVKEYAEEALKVFEAKESGLTNPAVEQAISNVDRLLILNRTPEELLKTLIGEAFRLTESEMAHVRYRDPDGLIAQLLPMSYGGYAKVAPSRLLLSQHHIAGIRVMKSGIPEVRGDATEVPAVRESLQSLPREARQLLETVNSYCIQPLRFEGNIIGSLALYKRSKRHYNETRIAIAELIADRIAPALHDYLVKIERSKEADEILALAARQDFAHRAVHNLRNPAAAAHAFLATLKRDFNLEPAARERVNKIETQIIRIEELVSNFLWYLKPIRFRIGRIDFEQLVGSVVDRYKETHQELQVTVGFESTQKELMADRQGLEWMIEELLENAVKMKASKVEVRGTLDSHQLFVSFEDNGLPVPTTMTEKLFEPFQSSDPMGTGLGLANVKRIIEEHRGSIEHDLSYSDGARFLITLPVEFSEAEGETTL